MVDLICEYCGKEFIRKKSEVERNKILGYKVFCSRECRKSKPVIVPNRAAGRCNLTKKIDDEYSPFRAHLKSIKCHAKKINKQVKIDEKDLKSIWEKQNGVCPITGWKLLNLKNTRSRMPHTPERASVDRIDSDGDYDFENIRFVCLMAQYAKNKFSDADLKRFCQAASNNSDW